MTWAIVNDTYLGFEIINLFQLIKFLKLFVYFNHANTDIEGTLKYYN